MYKWMIYFFCVCFLEAAELKLIEQNFIFDKAPFSSCHAATLTETSAGEIICAWFGGSEEGAEDVAIWLSRLDSQGWGALEKVVEAEKVPCWNPVLFTMPSGEVLLFYKVGRTPLAWSGMLKRSQDGGKHWSEAEMLPAGILGPIKNKPLLLTHCKNRLLCGSSVESWRRWGCFIEATEDAGKTWRLSNPINVPSQLFGIIQPTLFFSHKGEIKLLARSHQIGYICTATSKDQGLHWSQATATSLPNPNSAIDAVNLKEGKVLLVYNHSHTDRSPLNITLSSDGGETWVPDLILEDAPGEYSYPSVIQAKDGRIHIVYTWNRLKIKHVVLADKSQDLR